MLFTNGLQQVGLQGLPEWRLLHARVREGRGRTRFNVPSCADMDESPPCSQAAPVLFLVARNRNEESGELRTKRLCLLSQVTSLLIGQDPVRSPPFRQAGPRMVPGRKNRNEESGELSTKRLCLLSQVTSLFIGQDPIVCPLFKRDVFKEEEKASPHFDQIFY